VGRNPEQLARLAALMRNERTDRGLLARVRRHSVSPNQAGAAFDTQALLMQAGIDPGGSADFAEWALVAHCLALSDGHHSATASAGEQLAALQLSEARMRTLLQAEPALWFELLPRLARRAAAAGQALNWWQLAKPLLLARHQPRAAEEARRHLAAGYLRASTSHPTCPSTP
jgi:hypothetical protein